MDPRADDRQRGTLASRLERGRGRRHAATKHRYSRLRGGVPRRGGAAGHLVLQNDTARGLTHMTESSPLYSPECVEDLFCELRHNGVLGSPYRGGASVSTTRLSARSRSYARTASYSISKNRSREASSTTSTFASYSPTPAIPWWWTTVCPLHHSPPLSTATKRRSVLVATPGSRATAIAIGSASSNPPSHSSRMILWMSTQNSARGVPTPRSSADSSAVKVACLRETSRPTILMGMPEENTILAASGSTHTLNSATGVMLPRWSAAPPIITHPLTFSAKEGSLWRAIATLVSGPRVTSSTSPG